MVNGTFFFDFNIHIIKATKNSDNSTSPTNNTDNKSKVEETKKTESKGKCSRWWILIFSMLVYHCSLYITLLCCSLTLYYM